MPKVKRRKRNHISKRQRAQSAIEFAQYVRNGGLKPKITVIPLEEEENTEKVANLYPKKQGGK